MILFAGDIHGKINPLKQIFKDAEASGAKAIVQVGDFGIFWPKPSNEIAEYFNAGKTSIPLYFCDGNHENHTVLDKMHKEQGQPDVVEVAKNCYHVRRGATVTIDEKSILFFGGAQSYLGKKDTPFIYEENWWPREIPSKDEFDRFRASYGKTDIVVTHDCPSFMLQHQKYHKLWSKNGVPQFLGRVANESNISPPLWFFGHHHEHEHWDMGTIKYYCCGKQGESWLFGANKCVKTGIRLLK